MNQSQIAGRLRHLAILVIVAVFASIIYGEFFSGDAREIARIKFPDKTQVVAYLPEASTGQSLRLIRFAADGRTRLSGTIYWNSGLIEDLAFSKNVLVSSVEYYPEDDKENDPHTIRGQKRGEAKFAADGLTYVYHAVYRKDGTLERLGQLLASGNYRSVFYFDDGKAVERERIFDQLKHYQQEKIYRRDGSLLASIYSKAGDYSKTETSIYRADGSLLADFVRDPIDGEKSHVYAEDGRTMLVEYVHDYYGVQEIFLDKSGNLIQNRDGSRMGGLLTVRGYRLVNGKMLMEYRQRWTLTQTIGPDADKHRLLRVEYYDFVAKKSCEIQMDVAGTTPRSVTCAESDGTSTAQYLDGDGVTVKRTARLSKSGRIISSRDLSEGARQLHFPGQWFENYRPTPLPEWKDEGAPPPLYDYH